MTIAILGWGSLIWRPEKLAIDMTKGWSTNGPVLPIEFARISSDGRLTLVIAEKGAEIQTLYAISCYKNLDEAILDLAVREGCGKNKIGYLKKDNTGFPENNLFLTKVIDWLRSKDDIDAVIWTNLSKNFKDKLNLELTPGNAINYLRHLSQDAQAKAEEYIRKAPAVVNTPIRSAIEEALGWKIISQ